MVGERIGGKATGNISIFALGSKISAGLVLVGTSGNLLCRKSLCDTKRSRDVDFWIVDQR